MPPIEINNLIIFGDSMSDIGNKRETNLGKFARALKLMRTNDIGRYSDGKNWTDFIWEWSGGDSMVSKDKDTTNGNTAVHRSLTKNSSFGSSMANPIHYVNYAEGGAMGASDISGTGLGTFKEQFLRYLEQRKEYPLKGNTLHIIWFGLNDLVTNARDPKSMDYVADEIGTIMRSIDMNFGTMKEYFIVVNLPTPAGAVRLMKQNDLKAVAALHNGTLVFNKHIDLMKEGIYYDAPDRMLVVDMHDWLNQVNDHLKEYGLLEGAQPHGVPVKYGSFGDDLRFEKYRDHVATSDDAHPTEKVYVIIAQKIAEELITKFKVGKLTEPD